MNTWVLAWAWIRHRPLGAALNVTLLALGTATIALLMIASEQFEQRLQKDGDAVDMVVGAKGSPMQLVLSSVFHADVPVGNVPAEAGEMLYEHPMVKRAIPLALGDGFRGFRIVGTEPAYLELYGAEIESGRIWEQPLESVLGAATAARTGLETGDRFVGEHGIGGAMHGEFPYTVVGVLAPTGAVVDRLVLVSVPTVQIVHGMEPGHAHDDEDAHHEDHDDEAEGHAVQEDHAGQALDEHAGSDRSHRELGSATSASAGRSPEITAFLVEFSTPMAAVSLPRAINQSTVMQAARPALEIRRLFRLVGFGADVVRAFAVILVAGAVLGLFTALFQALEERRADLAMMRVFGATRIRLGWQILAESLILTVAGAALGLLVAHGVAWGAGLWLWEQNQILVSFAWADGEAALVLTVLVLGVLAALPSAVRAARIDIPRVLSGG